MSVCEGTIETITGSPSPEKFYKQYLEPRVPVLLKGAAKRMHAYMRWTDVHLAEKYGDIPFDFEFGKKETRDNGGDRATLREFLEKYQNQDVYGVSDVSKEMLTDLELLPAMRCGGAQASLSKVVMWFSSGNTHSVVHHDASENVNCLLYVTVALFFFFFFFFSLTTLPPPPAPSFLVALWIITLFLSVTALLAGNCFSLYALLIIDGTANHYLLRLLQKGTAARHSVVFTKVIFFIYITSILS